MGSESAKQPGETPDDEVIESEGGDATSEPATRPGDRSPGLLAELLEGAPREAPPSPRTRVGKLVAWTSGQAPRVEFEGNELGPLPARSTIRLDPTTILEAIAEGQGVLLSFEDGKPHAPIITGLLQPFDEEPPEVWQDEPEDSEAAATPISETEARVDGRRVEIEAADEIVLRCGEASIVLRRNGRVVIRGTYVETRSRGVNRVKGSTVEIN